MIQSKRLSQSEHSLLNCTNITMKEEHYILLKELIEERIENLKADKVLSQSEKALLIQLCDEALEDLDRLSF